MWCDVHLRRQFDLNVLPLASQFLCPALYTLYNPQVSIQPIFKSSFPFFQGHDDGSIRLWNMDTDSSLDLLQHSNSVMALKIIQVGKQDELLISAGYDGLLCIWDVRTIRGTTPHLYGRFQVGSLTRAICSPGAALKCLPRCEILCLEYHHLKRVIFTGGNDCAIKVR